jgi:hypothetical protein
MKFIVTLILILGLVFPAGACFGPKLYLGSVAGEDGELLFHLVSIYVKEKTGVESIRQEMTEDQTAESLLQKEQVDLAFSATASSEWSALLQVGSDLHLLSGPRPTQDLQFTTVPRALKKLAKILKVQDLELLREQVAGGSLPATAVRQLYMQRGWI